MFKKDPLQKLQKEREKTLKEAFEMSKVDRTKSDALMAKAEKIEEEILKLQSK